MKALLEEEANKLAIEDEIEAQVTSVLVNDIIILLLDNQ